MHATLPAASRLYAYIMPYHSSATDCLDHTTEQIQAQSVLVEVLSLRFLCKLPLTLRFLNLNNSTNIYFLQNQPSRLIEPRC